MKMNRLVGLTAALLFAVASPAAAQYYAFGKNKVQYESFQWHTLQGKHVEIYYYPEEEPLARLALVLAEQSYDDLKIKFQHDVDRPVPMIVFASHPHFEQNNVSPFSVPEGVQGFTEYLKGRVVLPFTGSYAEFRHVIHHEMVHVFQFSLLDAVYKKHRRSTYLVPPLWFSEGLAEYWSTEWDAQGTMVLSDMVLEGQLPTISDLWHYDGTFTIYKLGQSICEYIGETYGQDALRRLYTDIYKEDRFERLLGRVTGVSSSRLSEDWIYAMKRRYFPDVKDHVSLSAAAEERAVSQGVNLKPVAVPDTSILGGNRYVFLSARSGYTNIYSASWKGRERDVKSVVRGQRSPQFESFHPFQSRIDVSRKGELAFISKWNESDALFIMDLATKKVTLRRHFEGMTTLASPAWSPDGQSVAFSGMTPAGQSDLYLFRPATGELTRLTNDDYADGDPTWSPDGTTIAFASDRTRYGKDGHQNLFLIDVVSGDIRYLTCGPWIDQSPRWSPDGSRIAFASDRDGGFNLYAVDPQGNGARLTKLLGTALDPAWTPDGRSLLFTGFRRQGFGIYQMPSTQPEASADSFALVLEASPPRWGWEETLAQATEKSEPYVPRYGLDLLSGGLSFTPTENGSEGLVGAFSDLLGNRTYIFQVGNTAETAGDILSRMNAGAWYINRQHRWNYGVGLFHQAADFRDALDLTYFERRAGGSLVASYPFSRFSRIEGSAQAYYDQKQREAGSHREGFLTSHSLSLIRDNTLWFATGPRDGSRYNLTGALTTNWNTGHSENLTLSADFRRYLRVSQWTTLAMRVQGRMSNGADPERFVMGGTHSLRGYARRSIYGTRLYLANMEYRFPLFDHLVLGIPFRGLQLPGVEGAVFADAGNAWEKFEAFPRPKGSFGLGLRMSLGGYMVLRYDIARRTDFKDVQPGWEREFYLGFDF
ncbi:MAG TPA: BamA/TamA family outer membrane protein [Candidatus Limnocylindrales bacterium]|nr:BamA/TamA family outer membrane protein [Candidatus Limnocylindrales bacterium]